MTSCKNDLKKTRNPKFSKTYTLLASIAPSIHTPTMDFSALDFSTVWGPPPSKKPRHLSPSNSHFEADPSHLQSSRSNTSFSTTADTIHAQNDNANTIVSEIQPLPALPLMYASIQPIAALPLLEANQNDDVGFTTFMMMDDDDDDDDDEPQATDSIDTTLDLLGDLDHSQNSDATDATKPPRMKRHKHRKLEIVEEELLITSPVTRQDFALPMVNRFNDIVSINYGTAQAQIVHRIAPRQQEDLYDYCVPFVEDDLDFTTDKFSWGQKAGHCGKDDRKWKVKEYGCHGVFICENTNCRGKQVGSGLPFIVSASVSPTSFKKQQLAPPACKICHKVLNYVRCQAIRGIGKPKGSSVESEKETFNGSSVAFLYRLHPHSKWCLCAPNKIGLPSSNMRLVRELLSLERIPHSDQLLKGWISGGQTYSFTQNHPSLFDQHFREKILQRVKADKQILPSNKEHLADQFICVNSWSGEMEDALRDKSIGLKRDSWIFLQTPCQLKKWSQVIDLIVYYAAQDSAEDDDVIFTEIRENDDFKSLSSAGDATHCDFGNGQIITFIVRSNIMDRALPIAWGIKIADDWVPYCRFALNLFLAFVLEPSHPFTVNLLAKRFYNRHDFCNKYSRGWCVAMGILMDEDLCFEITGTDYAVFLRGISKSRVEQLYENGKVICDEIMIGCGIHKRRSVERVVALPLVVPHDKKELFFALYNRLDSESSMDRFFDLVKQIVTHFPRLKKYFEYWCHRSVILRAWPMLSGKKEELLNAVATHQQDIEWLHSNIKACCPVLKKNTNVDEVSKCCIIYTNNVFLQERMEAIGYKTQKNKRKYRKKKVGGVQDGRGYDKLSQFVNVDPRVKLLRGRGDKFNNILLNKKIQTMQKAAKARACHKFKVYSTSLHDIECIDTVKLNIVSWPVVKQ
eukprot:178725_1